MHAVGVVVAQVADQLVVPGGNRIVVQPADPARMPSPVSAPQDREASPRPPLLADLAVRADRTASGGHARCQGQDDELVGAPPPVGDHEADVAGRNATGPAWSIMRAPGGATPAIMRDIPGSPSSTDTRVPGRSAGGRQVRPG